MSYNDPRFVIDYGKYIKPGKDLTVGSIVAFLSVYAGLSEADYGNCIDGGYKLSSGIIAVFRGSFEHPLMGMVPLYNFMPPAIKRKDSLATDETCRLVEMTERYERNQAEFLKALMCGEFNSRPENSRGRAGRAHESSG